MVYTVAKDKGFISDGPINPVPARFNVSRDQFPTTTVRSQGWHTLSDFVERVGLDRAARGADLDVDLDRPRVNTPRLRCRDCLWPRARACKGPFSSIIGQSS